MRVLVVATEPVGARMAGPAIRACELARALADTCAVTLVGARAEHGARPPHAPARAGMADVEALAAAVREHDVVIAQELPPVVLERVARGPARLVADLYNPIVVEVLAGVAERPPAARRRIHGRIVARTLGLLAAADLVLCANERQRDLWIGGMALHGLLDPDAYARDPTLRSRVMVVPFGLPGGPPPAATGALRAAFPAIGAGDRVLVWGGGVWGWLDPGTAIAAVERLRGRPSRPARPRPARAGGDGPGGGRRGGRRGGAAGAGCSARGCTSTTAGSRTPSAARGSPRPTSGVSAHRDGAEARYAHRTRLLDYLWAGLPVVTTPGDALAARVERDGLGRRGRARGRRRVRRGLRADARSRGGRRPRADRRRRAGAALGGGRRAARRLVRRAAAAPARPPRRGAPRGARPVPLGAGRDARRRRAARGRRAGRPPAAPRGAMRRLDRVEAAALAALGGLSVLVLAALLTKGRALTGADGLLASDQLQYFTWIRQAGEHVLVGNEYDLAPDQRVFLHPGFLLSGLLHEATGITVPLSYLLWKPVAVALLVLGRAALRAPAAAARRRAPRRADPRRVLRAAGERARRLDGLGRQAAPVHVRLHRRASWARRSTCGAT